MSKVWCNNRDCVWCDGIQCCAEQICIDDSYEYGCETYLDYRDTDEYLEEYYKCVKTIKELTEGEIYVAKAKAYGKRIEYNGYVFYTESHPRTDETFVTEERTGYYLGSLEQLKTDENRWKTFEQRAKEIPSVDTLPLAEWDGQRHYVIVKGEQQ